jgi:ABC-2 type transport system ATP-binding protein
VSGDVTSSHAAAAAPPQAQAPVAPPSNDATIVLTDVSRWYGNVVAVNGISFSVSPGITGLLGPNGAGKSTLLHMLSGFLKPSAGEVSVLGAPAWQNPELYRRLGLVPEREAVYGSLTGYQFVRVCARLHGLPHPDEATRRAIREVDLEEAASRPTAGYSKGMKQRIKIAAALVHDPQVLLLDEPFNGADPRQRLHMTALFERLAAEGRTIIFSSHILEEVERLAERVLVIVGGRLAASGDFREIRRLMTDRPHTFTLRTTDDRRLAAMLVAHESVLGVDLAADRLTVRTSLLSAFALAVPAIARTSGVSILELRPTDESLEDVFAYLVSG